MIQTINQNNLCRTYNVKFQARPLAYHNYLKDKGVIIYQLEESDIGYLKHLVENLGKFFKKYEINGESAKQVLEEALNAGIAILKRGTKEKKARILMAYYDNEPSSILIGNTLKVDKKGIGHYSSRKEHGEKETELDWLVTWNKKIPGEGQSTVYEYFSTLPEDDFEDCFVRSELLKNSSAPKFYKRMGFHEISNHPRPILRKCDYPYMIGEYDDKADKIIPMLATAQDIFNTLREKANLVMRTEIKSQKSCTLPKEQF